MVRRIMALVALLFVLVILSFGVLAYGASSFEPERMPSVSRVETRSVPDPPEAPPLDMGRLWSAAIAQDPWPDLATDGRTGTSEGKIALTFDDGPDPRATPLVLNALRERDLQATFFVVGRQVAQNPGLLRRIVEEGHTIGNHTYDHADMSDMSPKRMRSELRSTQEAVDDALGYHHPMVLMRPPYGNPYFEGSQALPMFRRVVEEQGLLPVIWTVDSSDYLNGGRSEGIVQAIVGADKARRNEKSDEVVLLHDNHRQTARALPGIIDHYEESGRKFVDVGELLVDKYEKEP